LLLLSSVCSNNNSTPLPKSKIQWRFSRPPPLALQGDHEKRHPRPPPHPPIAALVPRRPQRQLRSKRNLPRLQPPSQLSRQQLPSRLPRKPAASS
jgi:hypothetical protein